MPAFADKPFLHQERTLIRFQGPSPLCAPFLLISRIPHHPKFVYAT
jgi:hypothetical protein